MDYYNSVLLAGLPACYIKRLQSIQTAAARLVFRIRRSQHNTDALISLHWLCVPESISYKLAVLMYRAINGSTPAYLQSCFIRLAVKTTAAVFGLSSSLYGQRTSFPSFWRLHMNDLPYHVTSAPHSRFSDSVLGHSNSPAHTRTFSFDTYIFLHHMWT